MTDYFKSVLEQDDMPIVLCDLEHTIIYMNPSAVQNYSKYGGAAILGQNLLNCHNPKSCEIIKKVVDWFGENPEHNKVHTSYDEKKGKDIYMIALRDSNRNLIGYYEKHECRNRDESPFYEM